MAFFAELILLIFTKFQNLCKLILGETKFTQLGQKWSFNFNPINTLMSTYVDFLGLLINILVLASGHKVKFHFPTALALVNKTRAEVICVMLDESIAIAFPASMIAEACNKMKLCHLFL